MTSELLHDIQDFLIKHDVTWELQRQYHHEAWSLSLSLRLSYNLLSFLFPWSVFSIPFVFFIPFGVAAGNTNGPVSNTLAFVRDCNSNSHRDKKSNLTGRYFKSLGVSFWERCNCWILFTMCHQGIIVTILCTNQCPKNEVFR